jgi:hypothetical protein
VLDSIYYNSIYYNSIYYNSIYYNSIYYTNPQSNTTNLFPRRYMLRIPQKSFSTGKFPNKRPVGKPKIRWEDVVWKETSQIVGIRGWRRRAADREERRRRLRGPWAQKRQ